MNQRRWTARDVIALLLVASLTSSACSSGCRSGSSAPATSPASSSAATSPAPAGRATTSTPSLSDLGAVGPDDAQAEEALRKLQTALKRVGEAIEPAMLDVRAAHARLGSDPRSLTAFVASQIGYEPYAGVLRGARGTLLARSGNAVDRALLLADLLRASGRTVRFARGELTTAQAEQVVRSSLAARGRTAAVGPQVEAITARARAQFIHLGNAMLDGGFTAPQGDAGRWAEAVEAARAHVWVQLADGNGWIDLDPTPGVEYGRSATAPAGYADAPAADEIHIVQFQIEAEIVSGGKAQRRTILTHDVRSADVAGVPIGLVHVRTSETAQPVLIIGAERIAGTPFPGPPKPSEAGFAFNFGSVFQPTERPTAEWIRIRTTGPSGSRQATYDVFDVVGPRRRADGAPVADQTIEDERTISKALSNLIGIAVNTGGVPAALPLSMLAGVGDPGDEAAAVIALATAGFSYQAARHRLPASLIDGGVALVTDGPSLVITAADDNQLALDLTLKRYLTLRAPDDRLAARGPFYDLMSAGVVDHTTERWLLDATFSRPTVGLLFERAAAQDGGIRLVTPPAAGAAPALTPDGAGRLAAASATGTPALIATRGPDGWTAPLGWWTVDPATGWTEDTNELGSHTASERAAHARWLQWIRNACTLARAGGVALSLSGFAEASFDPSLGHRLVDAGSTASAAGAMCGAAAGGGASTGSGPGGAAGGAAPPAPPPLPKGVWLPK